MWRTRLAEPRYKVLGVMQEALPHGQQWHNGVSVQMFQASYYIGTYVVASVQPNVAILLRRQGVVIGIYGGVSKPGDSILGDAYRWTHESLEPLFDYERKLGAEPVLIGNDGEMSKSLREFQDRTLR